MPYYAIPNLGTVWVDVCSNDPSLFDNVGSDVIEKRILQVLPRLRMAMQASPAEAHWNKHLHTDVYILVSACGGKYKVFLIHKDDKNPNFRLLLEYAAEKHGQN